MSSRLGKLRPANRVIRLRRQNSATLGNSSMQMAALMQCCCWDLFTTSLNAKTGLPPCAKLIACWVRRNRLGCGDQSLRAILRFALRGNV